MPRIIVEKSRFHQSKQQLGIEHGDGNFECFSAAEPRLYQFKINTFKHLQVFNIKSDSRLRDKAYSTAEAGFNTAGAIKI